MCSGVNSVTDLGISMTVMSALNNPVTVRDMGSIVPLEYSDVSRTINASRSVMGPSVSDVVASPERLCDNSFKTRIGTSLYDIGVFTVIMQRPRNAATNSQTDCS